MLNFVFGAASAPLPCFVNFIGVPEKWHYGPLLPIWARARRMAARDSTKSLFTDISPTEAWYTLRVGTIGHANSNTLASGGCGVGSSYSGGW